MNVNKHKYYMLQILKDIYNDTDLSSLLGFKGGTALMFFYNLPRFSVDLDFNLLDKEKEQLVYERVQTILLKYGRIIDAERKFYGPIIVLDYGAGERNLKVEISNRVFQNQNHYELRSLLGINVNVMSASDMFAHKLCALLDRAETTNRDVFDCWFFLENHTPINSSIVEERMGKPLTDYIQDCINRLETLNDKQMHVGLGELLDGKMKNFVHTKLRQETISLLHIFQAVPLVV
ncbi:MAG: nucleotidyl transferase AbiEii/AbiGii toxin family protein [Paludibacteraceae bacterium]|nr:nucleotidyl transferase AbiEii/AbiGii toxin family protein [Paludibacteraceae bacterium]